jgi:hypothetical protein
MKEVSDVRQASDQGQPRAAWAPRTDMIRRVAQKRYRSYM